ncbi:30S processome protein Utp24 [Candidatus Bathyarchaeota archaeon]|nr:MAG: 30S processome protein Utp24 [Candidatus Bathyarchaeota archaeon]
MLLDSNFLLVPILFGVDIFEEIPKLLDRDVDFILLRPVYEEMRRLAIEGSPKVRKEASSALELSRGRCLVMDFEASGEEEVDDILLRAAEELRCPVATNDGALRRRLRERGVPVIYLRQKSLLKIDGWVPDP